MTTRATSTLDINSKLETPNCEFPLRKRATTAFIRQSARRGHWVPFAPMKGMQAYGC